MNAKNCMGALPRARYGRSEAKVGSPLGLTFLFRLLVDAHTHTQTECRLAGPS